MSKINFFFYHHTQTHISLCVKSWFIFNHVKSIFSFIKTLKLKLHHMQNQIFLWPIYSNSYLIMSKLKFSFDEHISKTQVFFLSSYLKSYLFMSEVKFFFDKHILDMSKVDLSFDKHIQSHIWTCLKSKFFLTNILKVIFV
jgi:hypothetical protein